MSSDPRYDAYKARGGTLPFETWSVVMGALKAAPSPTPPSAPPPAPPPPPARVAARMSSSGAVRAPAAQTEIPLENTLSPEARASVREMANVFAELDRLAGVDPKTAPKPVVVPDAKTFVDTSFFQRSSKNFRPLTYKQAVSLGAALGGLEHVAPYFSGYTIADGVHRYVFALLNISVDTAKHIISELHRQNAVGYNQNKPEESAKAQAIFTKRTGLTFPLQQVPPPDHPFAIEVYQGLLDGSNEGVAEIMADPTSDRRYSHKPVRSRKNTGLVRFS
jgi:hypothetical protein